MLAGAVVGEAHDFANGGGCEVVTGDGVGWVGGEVEERKDGTDGG